MSKMIAELAVTATPSGALLPADLAGSDAAVIVGGANGLTVNGADGKVLPEQLPAAILGQVIYQGLWDANAGTPPSADPAKGWYYIVTVAGGTNLSGTTEWKVGDWAIYNGASWNKVDNTDAVSSVAGLTGPVAGPALKTALAIVKGDVGLGNVDNTSDANKPVSTAQAAAIAGKAPADSAAFTGTRPSHSGAPLGYRDLPQNVKNQAYTLALADAGGEVIKTDTTAYAWTIPPNSAVAFPIGTMITLRVKSGTGVITITRGSGVVLRKAGAATDANVALAVWGLATLKKEAADEWVVSGTGV